MNNKILLADYSSTFGGAPEFAVSLTKYLVNNHQTDVTLLSPQNDLLRRAEQVGADSIELKINANRSKGIIDEILLYELPLVIKVIQAIYKSKADIIQLNNIPNAQRSGIIAAKLTAKPCIQTHQGFECNSRSVRMLLPMITHHVAISTAVERELYKLNVQKDKVTRIPDGIDTQKFNKEVTPINLNAEFNIPNNSKVIAIFGRIMPWKGQKVFIEIVHRLRKIDDTIYALIVGDCSDGDRAFLDTITAQVKALGLSENIIFTGKRNDIPTLMKAVDLVMHLSQEPEPLGLVVAEALSVGTPVVAMNEGGVPDMLQDGKSGFLCAPNNVDEIVNKTLLLINDRQLCRQFGEYGSTFINREFSCDRIAKQYSELYKRLLK